MQTNRFLFFPPSPSPPPPTTPRAPHGALPPPGRWWWWWWRVPAPPATPPLPAAERRAHAMGGHAGRHGRPAADPAVAERTARGWCGRVFGRARLRGVAADGGLHAVRVSERRRGKKKKRRKETVRLPASPPSPHLRAPAERLARPGHEGWEETPGGGGQRRRLGGPFLLCSSRREGSRADRGARAAARYRCFLSHLLSPLTPHPHSKRDPGADRACDARIWKDSGFCECEDRVATRL